MDDVKRLWVEELLNTLWAIRIIVHSGIKDTLFNLTFGSNAVISIEVGINSLIVTHLDSRENEIGIQANLNLLDEVREDVSFRVAVRQRQVAQYYNKRVKTRKF